MAEQAQTIGVAIAAKQPELVKGLGLFDSTMIVCGSMIGSGIFIVSADIAHQVQSPALLLAVWVVAGIMTIIGALSYGELAAAMPHAGGQYVYLRESLGPLWGFLYGWTMLLVIQTATIAAVAIAFAKFTAVMIPWFSPTQWIWKLGTIGPWQFWFGSLGPYNVGLNRQNLLAIASIIFLTWINTRGLRTGKDRPEHFHGCEGRFASRARNRRMLVIDRHRAPNQFHRFLAQRRPRGDASLPRRSSCMDHRHAHLGRRSNGRRPFFR